MNMKEVIENLSDAKEDVLGLRDEANHDEYPKYAEVYEAILEAEKIAKKNFEEEVA